MGSKESNVSTGGNACSNCVSEITVGEECKGGICPSGISGDETIGRSFSVCVVSVSLVSESISIMSFLPDGESFKSASGEIVGLL
jgi:hypothetical protein